MFWRRKRNPEDFAEEIRAHLAIEADELQSEGAADANQAARRAFGNVAALQERSYERRRIRWFDDLRHDLRYAARTFRRNPAYAVGTALLLALGIGANTAIFSFVEAILLKPLPVPDPHSLLLLKWHAPDNPKIKRSINGEAHRDPVLGYVSGNFPFHAFQQLALDRAVITSAFGFANGGDVTVLANETAGSANSLFVTGGFFGGLQVLPALGRAIDLQDDRPDAPPAAVLGYTYWQTRFHGDPGVVGRAIQINNQPFVIAGVAPKGFYGIYSGTEIHVYLPLRYYQELRTTFVGRTASVFNDDRRFWVNIMARLKPGVSRKQAETVLAATFAGWIHGVASTDAERVNLPMLHLEDGATGLDYLRIYHAKPIFLVAAMAALILAITCANLASLQLARALARRREISLRYGLGAGRWRIARQMLTESILLAAIGGVLSVAFAWAGMRGLAVLTTIWQPDSIFRATFDWNCALVSACLALLAGLVFGIGPAIQAARFELAPGLKEARGGAPRGRLRNGLVTIQIALSLLLVADASLFVRTVANLRNVSLGFQPDGLFAFEIDGRQAGHKQDALVRLYSEIESRLSEIPGVRSAVAASDLLASGSHSSTSVSLPGYPAAGNVQTAVLWVGPEFFSTLRIPLAAGRDFNRRDSAASPMSVVVNEAFAARYLTGDPLGQSVRFFDPENATAVIVGVARNTPVASPRSEVEPIVFGPYSQHAGRVNRMSFVMRSEIDGVSLSRAARAALEAADRRVPFGKFTSLPSAVQRTFGQERLLAILCSAFAILALVIASVGLYGTLAYDVSRRATEIGIRIAIGAKPGAVISMILRQSVWMIAAGVALGLPFIWTSGKVIGQYLYGAQPDDASSLATPVAVLLASALIAAAVPAARAARIDPISTLRRD